MAQHDPPRMLANGSLATRRRTVAGILGRCSRAGLEEAEIRAILRLSGLPARAAADPDFPVSMDRELTALSFMLRQVVASRRTCAEFAVETLSGVGINHFGVLGLTMQHAPTVLAALNVMLAYPEMCWGHSRVVAAVAGGCVTLTFEMGAPAPDEADAEVLREYCVTTDLICVEHLIGDIIDRAVRPLCITLPFTDPGTRFCAQDWVACPVAFGAAAAEIRYPAEIADAVPVRADDLPFRRYDKSVQAFSSLLAEEEDIGEQSSRLLWAYKLPPSREQLADMLGMSTRTLARRLKAAGTSYAELRRRVQTERAKNYLRHSSAPIADVAEHLGYSDSAAFNRAFLSWTGVPPARWRSGQRADG